MFSKITGITPVSEMVIAVVLVKAVIPRTCLRRQLPAVKGDGDRCPGSHAEGGERSHVDLATRTSEWLPGALPASG